jgi:hypothetical protein
MCSRTPFRELVRHPATSRESEHLQPAIRRGAEGSVCFPWQQAQGINPFCDRQRDAEPLRE